MIFDTISLILVSKEIHTKCFTPLTIWSVRNINSILKRVIATLLKHELHTWYSFTITKTPDSNQYQCIHSYMSNEVLGKGQLF